MPNRTFSTLRLLCVIATLLVFFCSGGLAAAQGETTRLGIRQIGGTGSYIDLILEPGASQEVTVELGNFGDAPAVAYTYLADVYSLINGGMGVSLEETTGSGMSGWVDYAAQTTTLDAHSALHRSFMVSIPPNTQPGEYLTSIVIQGEASDVSGEGGVALNQVSRQAIAIAVLVPGPQQPALSIGAASHTLVGSNSRIRVELHNSGNVRLQPEGEVVLYDAAGAEVSRYPVKMGSIYAGTTTSFEVPFAGALLPGDYTIALELSDAKAGPLAQNPALPLRIEAPIAPTVAPASEGPQAAPINQTPVVQAPAPNVGLSIPSDVLFVVGLALLIMIAFVPMLRRRRR
ncbi:hypothetical protein [Candidatus Chloroploca asiatica]|uniref:CARDB domain-containing protein n=1 Tax=Candidatus Chloroploca asiatica TaxID=1506545 RepID=A0A2H3KHE4_9CHLR|nr:hypothetical protein [Candidatus Chloroploca asiatica]PDV97173.1 hypothetical protein A9Q02_04495 [Candidatus Chloroploca asiatica]